ncbi:glycosyltransferase involved in cell wall biosynthesis [Mucilaginibacter yixingensis]|uniref:Glycosyltransferase involved in cell wall biosynthesis n=1 Tax=Mucilaginibacter yixingensis TaxID=1295612 RepID=A0A2T5JCW3_9SPHI|nr:glycosyltransferase [Mucilaginibacter yixingensis]PTQ99603.1 glycosyltransferase involved in cell wall biosynthesis [Mucilaginibacter yixingensis]
MKDNNLMLSVCCITYNHEKFIGEALDGFLMQKTNFSFDIVIGDDCSTDGTSDVITTYQEQYPDKIKLIRSSKNIGAHENMRNVVKACTGKYIALCDGDDYWTDPNKLQKQVDFLEQHPDYVMCCHYTRVIDTNYNTLHVDPSPKPLVHTYHDLLVGKQEETKTATVVYRNVQEISQIFDEAWYLDFNAADKLLKIFATYKTAGKIYVMPEVMSCYRNHVGGIWSMIEADARRDKVINDFNQIIRRFSYRGREKRKLLLLYLKRDILFELRRFRIRKAFDTLRYLI